jgi:hypothetical protein
MNLRQEIAQRAAALIAEGLDDYHQAKLKAAKSLNVTDKQSLPDNIEIEVALREHHALFASDTQPIALQALREAACRAMQWLGEFQPWLTGSVLNGTANEFSAIQLELIGIDVKRFELFLLNEDVVFEIREHHGIKKRSNTFKLQRAIGDGGYSYEITFDDAPVEITLFESHSTRQTRYPRDSIFHDRVQFDDAVKRFNEN